MKPFMSFKDPKTGRVWKLDNYQVIKNVKAHVSARWVMNCVVPKEILKKLIKADFLEPILVKDKAILSLCCIFMKHAAPSWMPLQLGPSSHNCALRVAVTDTRDDSAAVWVDTRHTDSFLAPVLEPLGFPAVQNGLEVKDQKQTLELRTAAGHLHCQLQDDEHKSEFPLFEKDSDFDQYFSTAIRSYSQHDDKGQLNIIDLHKLTDNRFMRQNMQGTLNTPYGNWFVESVYLTEDGHYEWVYEGNVKQQCPA
jgi:hypothetical protein